MREIKFRAWDKKNNVYYKSIWGLGWGIGGIRFFWDDYKHSDGETMVTDLPDGDYELMQFTGLHDKNGKKIFEGDLVINERGEKGKIVFINGSFVSKYLPPYDWDVFEHYDGLLSEQTIIGNIYENPELLNEATDGT